MWSSLNVNNMFIFCQLSRNSIINQRFVVVFIQNRLSTLYVIMKLMLFLDCYKFFEASCNSEPSNQSRIRYPSPSFSLICWLLKESLSCFLQCLSICLITELEHFHSERRYQPLQRRLLGFI